MATSVDPLHDTVVVTRRLTQGRDLQSADSQGNEHCVAPPLSNLGALHSGLIVARANEISFETRRWLRRRACYPTYILALKLRRQPKDVRTSQFYGIQRNVFAWCDWIAVEGPHLCVLTAAGNILESDRLELD